MTKKGTSLAGAADLQRKLTQMAQAQQGKQPEAEIQNEYESAVGQLQASSTYQRLVAAQG